jgi:hypothetical protein
MNPEAMRLGAIKKPWKIPGFLVGETGFEPATLWSQTRCATGLRYSPQTATPTGFEPVTVCLEGRCSIQLSYGVPWGGCKGTNSISNMIRVK